MYLHAGTVQQDEQLRSHLHYSYLVDVFIQSELRVYLTKQGTILPGAMLGQGPTVACILFWLHLKLPSLSPPQVMCGEHPGTKWLPLPDLVGVLIGGG